MLEELQLHGLIGSGGSNIKSIQRGTVANTSATVSITEVDLSKSIVMVSAHTTTRITTATNLQVSAKFNSSTEINLNRVGTDGIVSASWVVIEFKNVKSLQRGSTTLTGNVINQGITTVVLAKAVAFVSHRTTGNAPANSLVGHILTADNLQFKRYDDGTCYSEWQIIEFS